MISRTQKYGLISHTIFKALIKKSKILYDNYFNDKKKKNIK